MFWLRAIGFPSILHIKNTEGSYPRHRITHPISILSKTYLSIIVQLYTEIIPVIKQNETQFPMVALFVHLVETADS